MRRLAMLLLAPLALTGCTTIYQVRGTENFLKPMAVRDLVGSDEVHRARQISMEHQSIEKYDDFSLGVIEISDGLPADESQGGDKELHVDALLAIALTRLAAPALDVERETPGCVAACARFERRCAT